METDYKNYDRLFVAVKLNKSEELERCYGALGWECVGRRDDKIYRGMVHLTYRRPHRIDNKDELQLLQVYLEAALNDEGRLDRKSMPRTAAVGIITAFLTAAFLVLGLCLEYLGGTAITYVSGIVFTACSVAMLLLAVTAILKVFFKEREGRKEKLAAARAEIAAVLEKAALLVTAPEAASGNEIVDEAAASSEEADGEE